jgi:hypothetical protein
MKHEWHIIATDPRTGAPSSNACAAVCHRSSPMTVLSLRHANQRTALRLRQAMNHKWGAPVRTAETWTPVSTTVRKCVKCGAEKITMHPPSGLPWNEWRLPGVPQFRSVATPPCRPPRKAAGAFAASSARVPAVGSENAQAAK